MSSGIIVVKREREKPVRNQHPWVFSGAIETVQGSPQPGEMVTVVSARGDFLARGYFNPASQIQVRLLTWRDEPIDAAWWQRTLRRALAAREPHHRQNRAGALADGYRLVNAESDYLPGLIVDCYGEWLVLQALTLHIDQIKTALASWLVEAMETLGIRVRGVYERSDVDVRKREGLEQAHGLLWGEEPPKHIRLANTTRSYLVDLREGHKTGSYLDQRDNRRLLETYLADTMPGAEVRLLNLFSYTGGFGLSTQAHVTNVDASREALQLAEQIYKLNNRPAAQAEYIQADVFDLLRYYVGERAEFDAIVCDPPKFANTSQQVEKAARGYKDLNLNCFKLVKPGGCLMTFSCSGAVDADLFQKIVFGALADAGRQAQVLRHLEAGDDHPVALTFPEGAYLKGLLLRVY